jgi:hypothetical protein
MGDAMNTRKVKKCMLLVVFLMSCVAGCKAFVAPDIDKGGVFVPYLKNTPNECYYLDEFMPVPDGIVSGKNGAMSVRYYNYKTASYKEWHLKEIILAFYSKDGRCWSLFEEYYVGK